MPVAPNMLRQPWRPLLRRHVASAAGSVRLNQFKRRLRERNTQLGLWGSLASPQASEMLAHAGFDWLVVDMEHAPTTLPEVLQQLQVLQPSPCEPIVRVPSADDPYAPPEPVR
eukprot:6183215-Pleurochrysis_carterae.AAC.3